VCYTNHALDQFLEGIVNTAGFKKTNLKWCALVAEQRAKLLQITLCTSNAGNRRYHLPGENYSTRNEQIMKLEKHAANIRRSV
jgi:hypothetical protein